MSRQARHFKIPHGTCIISKLVTEFEGKSFQDIHSTLIVLPTHRLQVHFAAQMAQTHEGASWLPQMMSWDEFVESLCIANYDHKMVMVSSLAELSLKRFIAGQPPNPFFTKDHSHELLHFLQELWRHGTRHTALHDMNAWLDRQWHLSDVGKNQIVSRLEATFSILSQFEEFLDDHGTILKERQVSVGITKLLRELGAGLELPYQRVIVAGLTSLPLTHLLLLQELKRSHPVIETWFDETWDSLDQNSGLHALHRMADPTSPKQNRQDIHPKIHSPEVNHSHAWNVRLVHFCADPLQESAVALRRAKELHETGIPWHRISVVVPDEAIYSGPLAALAGAFADDRNIPLARSWGLSMAGTWTALYVSWASNHAPSELVKLLKHNFTQYLLEAQMSESQDWQTFFLELEQWLRNAPLQMPNIKTNQAAFRQLSTKTKDALLQLIHLLSPDLTSKSPSTWWCNSIVPSMTAYATSKTFDVVERSAWKTLTDAANALESLPSGFLPPTMRFSEFLQALSDHANESSPRDTGEPLSGLQIISLTEARYVPCDALILMGCAEGVFPHRLPKDTLVDNALKVAAKMPGWRQLEALEETTFHLLVSRVQHVELTTPRVIGNTVTTRSRWIERLMANKVPFVHQGQEALSKALSMGDFQSRDLSVATLEGVVSTPEHYLGAFSASSLKAFMTCPYQHLLQKSGIRPFELLKEDDPRSIGKALHHVIEICCKQGFDQEMQVPQKLSWRDHFESPEDVAAWSLERLLFLSTRLIPIHLQDSPLVIEMMHKGWKKLAIQWSETFKLGFNPAHAHVELHFGRDPNPVSIDLLNKSVLVTGVMDAIHVSPDGQWHISDYKLTGVPSALDVRQGLEPQLLLYAMCLPQVVNLPRPESTKGIVSYWSLSDGESTTISTGLDLSGEVYGHFGKTKIDLNSQIQEFKQAWQNRLDQVEKARWFFADSKNCGFCHFENICRKNDPVHQDRIKAQEVL